jgi:hypothetical protein
VCLLRVYAIAAKRLNFLLKPPSKTEASEA